MKKVFTILTLFIASFTLVACNKELSNEDLYKSFETLGDNYKIDITISFYNEVEASIEIYFDGNNSLYIEGKHIEIYYIKEGRYVTTIEKRNDKYQVVEEGEQISKDYNIFSDIDSNWFEISEGKEFNLLDDHLNDMLSLFNFSDDISLKGATFKLDKDNQLEELNFNFEEDRDNYFLIMKISDKNEVNIIVPEVD